MSTAISRPAAGRELTRLQENRWVGLAVVLAVTTAIPLALPAPTPSGILLIQFAAAIQVVAGAGLVLMLVTGRYRIARPMSQLLVLVCIFLVWVIVVSAIRFTRGDEIWEALFMLRTSVLTLTGLFIYDAHFETPDRAIRSLILLEACVGVWLFISGEWLNPRMSTFLVNSNITATLLTILIPLNWYALTHDFGETRVDRFIFHVAKFNLLLALLFPVWIGSRSAVFVMLATTLASAAFQWRQPKARKWFLILVAAALSVHLAMAVVNPWGANSGLHRLIQWTQRALPAPPPANTSALPTSQASVEQAPPPKPVEPTAGGGTTSADVERAGLFEQAWEKIAEDPWIGSGEVLLHVKNSMYEGMQSPHNFLLEGALAYGVPGMLLYLVVLAVAIRPSLSALFRTRGRPQLAAWTAIMSLGSLLVISLVQPTYMSTIVVTICYLVVGAAQYPLLNRSGSEERAREVSLADAAT